MKVDFRMATSYDVEKIIELCNFVFEEKTDVSYAKKVYEETNDDKNQIYIVGEAEGKIIAHTKITIIPTIYGDMNTYAILNHVCVHPDYRRHNIATKMLDECEKICKSRGCVCIELWSNNFRTAAHKCYKNYGFIANDTTFFSKKIK